MSCFSQISTSKSTAETRDNGGRGRGSYSADTVLLGLGVCILCKMDIFHLQVGSAQPENIALVSLGWSEGTTGASPEDCRQTDGRPKLYVFPQRREQMHLDAGALWMVVLPVVVLAAIQCSQTLSLMGPGVAGNEVR